MMPRIPGPGGGKFLSLALRALALGVLTFSCNYDDPAVTTTAGTGNLPTAGSVGTAGRPPGGGGGPAVSAGAGGTTPGAGGTTPGSGGTNPGAGGTTPGSGGTNPGAGAAGAPPATAGATGGGSKTHADYKKPRIIVSTDGEIDDRSTFVRYLMYASDYDTVGIVQNNSRYQKSGHSKDKWVEKEIDLYAQALPNLKKHNPDYPEASALLSLVRVGNENNGDLFVAPASMATKETPGSKLMIEQLLNDDPRPLHVATWGGSNTLAYALYTLKTTQPEKLAQVAGKLWVYCIWYQDNGGQWIEENVPEVNIYEAYRWDNIWDYQSLSGPSPADVKAFMTSGWLNENVKTNHGALGAYTPQSYVSEGDTPSILPHINNGLYQFVDYTWGGWGGRPIFDKGRHMTDKGVTSDDGNEYKSFWRWIPTLQNDFAARMDWVMASEYSMANHNPIAQVVGDLQRDAAGGETVSLDASPTTDPDNNNLTFKWWQYYDADSAAAKVTIANDTTKSASFVVPSEPGKQIHIILEVTDDGTPALTNYQRLIFNLK